MYHMTPRKITDDYTARSEPTSPTSPAWGLVREVVDDLQHAGLVRLREAGLRPVRLQPLRAVLYDLPQSSLVIWTQQQEDTQQ